MNDLLSAEGGRRGQARGHVRQPYTRYNPRHHDEPWSDPVEAGARSDTVFPSGRSELTYAVSVRGSIMLLSGSARILVMVEQQLLVEVIVRRAASDL